jgi:phosphate transport system substrate-binding protein
VPVVNLKGIKSDELKLTGPVIADIYLGKITKWNDPAIAALNKGVKLPDQDITVVHRSDGSGTTFIWVNYLSKVSPEWKSKVGEGTSVAWPAGVGGKGNEGVSSYVQRIDGAIGYVEYAYAKQNKMAYADLINSAGKRVTPNAESFQAAAGSADWTHAAGYYLILTNQPGDKSWPITGASFILVYSVPPDPAATGAALKFFDWAYKNGAKMAAELDYVPLPDGLIQQVRNTWKTQIKGM